MGKKITEDEIKYIISVESAKAQQELHKLGKETKALEKEERARRKQLIEMEAQGKKDSKEYRNLSDEIRQYSKQISENKKQMGEQSRAMDVNILTMAQLRKQAKELRSQLESTSKSLNPEEYNKLESQLKKVNGRMSELKESSTSLEEVMRSDAALSTMAGMIWAKAAEGVANYIMKMKEFADEGIVMAEKNDGVLRAFKQLDQPGLLDNLRQATKGTVNDLSLMQAAVKAKDFRIPLQDMGKYLAFAQLKAQQTGQSVDYMTESIVTGLGRQSVLILDNLGLSSAEINEEISKTGDFMSAVATIVDKQLVAAGGKYVSAADRAQQKTVALQNAQLKLGETLLPLKEKYDEVMTSTQVGAMNAISWLVKNKLALEMLIIAVSAYAVAVNLATIKTKIATATMTLFNAVTKANPLGLIISLVTTAAAGFALFSRNTKEATASQEALASVTANVKNKMEEERAKIDALSKVIHDNNQSNQVRQQAINKLKEIIPGYHAMLSAEGKLINDNTGAIDLYLKKLEQKIIAEASEQQLTELYKKKNEQDMSVEKERKRMEARIKMQKEMNNSSSSPVLMPVSDWSPSKDFDKEVSKLKETEQAITDVRKKMADAYTDLFKLDAAPETKKDLIAEKQKEIEEAEKVVASTKEEIIARNKKVQALKSELEALQNLGIVTQKQQDEAKAKALKKQLDAQTAIYTSQQIKLKEAYVSGQDQTLKTQEQYNARMEALMIDDLKARMAINGLEASEAQALADKLMDIKVKALDDEKKLQDKRIEEAKKRVADDLDNVDKQQKKEELTQLERYANNQITKEEYNKSLSDIDQKYLEERLRVNGLTEEQITDIRSKQINARVAQSEAETAKIETSIKAQVEAYKGYGASMGEALGSVLSGQEDLLTAFGNSMIDILFDVLNQIINQKIAEVTAVVIAEQAKAAAISYAQPDSVATFGLTGTARVAVMTGLIAAGMTAAKTALKGLLSKKSSSSSSSSSSTPSTPATGSYVATGKESGGSLDVVRRQDGKLFPGASFDPMARGYIDRPTVIVGEGPAGKSREFVLSNAAVDNPTIAPILSLIDHSQQAGTIRTLDLNKAMLAHMSGFASGGSLSTPTSGPSASRLPANNNSDILSRLEKTLRSLQENGIPASVSLSELDQKQQLRDKSKNIARK